MLLSSCYNQRNNFIQNGGYKLKPPPSIHIGSMNATHELESANKKNSTSDTKNFSGMGPFHFYLLWYANH